jgi:hypothetical protein
MRGVTMIEVQRWRVEQYTRLDGWVEMATVPEWDDARSLMMYMRREGARGVRILDLTLRGRVGYRGQVLGSSDDDHRAVLTIL